MAAAAFLTSRNRSKRPAWRRGGVAWGGRAARAPPAAGGARGAARAPCVLEDHEDPLRELLGDPLLLGDPANLDQAPVVGLGQVSEGLEGIEAALGDSHSVNPI